MKADVAVIGAGYTGLSAAYHIKRLLAEREVIVLEAEGAGYGASGRNGGMALNQPSMDYMSMVRPETHRLTYDATAQCIREISELMKTNGCGSFIRPSGSLLVNKAEKGAEKSKEYAGKTSSMGVPIEYWDRERVADEIGTKVYAGGLHDPNAAELEPMKMVQALKRAAENAGVVIYENSPVLRVDEGKPIRLLVRGADGGLRTVTAGAVVLGTDAYSSKLGFFKSRLPVLHTEIAATKVLDKDALSDIGWASRIPFHDDHMYLYHLGTTDDNRIIIGAGNAEYFFNDSLTYKKDLNKRRKALHRELVRIYPELKGVELEHIWTGALTYSFNMAQSVGVTGKNKNIYYGIGYSGHGVTLSFLFGKVIADIHAGEDDKWKRMPFYQNDLPPYTPPEPLRYIAVKSYMGYMRILDMMKGD
ncbi:MAG: FAD-dependent oxidoreductase [Candidatus Thermoplasmatota archaeon]|nr:FAD-dependent oxidoreductase [Candidatus Thermoplasmatota archaeon]